MNLEKILSYRAKGFKRVFNISCAFNPFLNSFQSFLTDSWLTPRKSTVEMTRGYPYLLQLIGYYLLEYAGNSPEITADHIQLANTSAKRDMIENIYVPVVKSLSDKDMQFLKAMAMDGNTSRISEIKKRFKASDGLTQAYRKRLLDTGVISTPRRGEVAFTLPYFHEYLCGNL